MASPSDLDLTTTEKDALHDLQLGIEHLYCAYGQLLDFHHKVGHAMDRFADAEERLREAGHGSAADELRDVHLPASAVGDLWTYEMVEEFRSGLLTDATDFEHRVRSDLANGVGHVTEREQQREWRRRAREPSSRYDSD
ncbi:MAG: hypothetical protein ACQETI_07165 [Halobacteriota archaeon]